MVCKSFILVGQCNYMRPVPNMSLKPASNNIINVQGKIMHLVQLGDLQVRVHFVVVGNLTVPLIVGKLFIDRVFKGTFLLERRIFPIWCSTVGIIFEFSSLSYPLPVFQTSSEAGTDYDDRQDDITGTLPFRVAKCVATLLNTEVAISVTSSSAGLLSMALQPN